MKILDVLPSIDSESGGPVRATLENCLALQGVDGTFRFSLATTDQQLEERWLTTFRAEMPAGMQLHIFKAVGRGSHTFSPSLMTWLWRNAADFDLMIVGALLNPISSAAAWIARRRGTPYVVVPHGTLSHYTFEHRRTMLKRIYYRLIERYTLAGAAAVRFTSESERAEAPVWAGDQSAWVIPHPFEPRFSPGHLREERPRQVLFLSRLDPMKGISTLLEALPLVLEKIDNVRLVLAGAGTATYEQEVRSAIREAGLEEVVESPGFVEGEEKQFLLKSSALFVLPSQRENFGIAIVEAMDAGLPVVISDAVGIWPQIEGARAGIVLKRRTPTAIAAAVVRLLENERLRLEMGRRGQQLVRTAFAPKIVGRQLSCLYRSAAPTRAPLEESCEA